ncbi:MerR family transcriptional regulator [Leucobacter sp. CSA2]|uniref:MerR family transcriptional regulator n=1 Tax=Leucobacter edaphi TaxID=2796472 RepID=A0A934QDT1_9MICO|nr:MerR family transcriptional regulator [Leucobacter edaphi]MBK0422760.1 MerR family transcriptional regulator [Leucobacter edaphi]
MKISDLVARSGVPLATVKFYIREGMLAPGHPVGARRSEYDDTHLGRLQLIRALTAVAGVPLSRAKEVLSIIDDGNGDIYEILSRTIQALSPTDAEHPHEHHPHATWAITQLGKDYAASDESMAAYSQLDESLRAAEEAGLPIGAERLRLYGDQIMTIARAEVGGMPADPREAASYAALGTVIAEPVLASLRRLAHQNLAAGLDQG